MSHADSEPEVRDYVDVLPDVVVVIDPHTLRLVEVNRAGGSIYGYSREQLLHLHLPLLLPQKSKTELLNLMAAVLGGRIPPQYETTVRQSDGDDLPVDLRFAVEPASGFVVAALRDIRHRMQVEEQLRQLNVYLDAIVENIPDMIFVKHADTLLFERFNRAGEELLGWTRQELLGKTDHDFYPKEQADFFHLKDRETLKNKKLVDIAEEPISTKAHGLRWLHTKKIPILDAQGNPKYLMGISEDITGRKLAEERVRELAQVVNGAREAIVAWTPDGKIVSFNPAAEALYGLSSDAAANAKIESLVPESARREFHETQARVLKGEKVPISEAYRVCRGQEVEVEESLFAIHDQNGTPMRVVSIARDISELKRLRRAAEILGGAAPVMERTAPSSRMRDTFDAADIVAEDAHATILLLGETGVGKSWLARYLHARSPRAAKPLFELNCASLESNLIESELFGHERGAFTGAVAQKRGIVEVADGGTLFLDEVGELPASAQAKLLTFLEQRTFRRLGGTRTLTTDVRLIAATNAELKKLVERGTFRRDLYFRLSVVPLEVPPLRERREEIPQLAKTIVAELQRRPASESVTIERSALGALMKYDWPGNIRELRNALERALILSRGDPIKLSHLPPEMTGKAPASGAGSDRLEEVERAHIVEVLDRVAGNRTRAAALLGISRSTLQRKLAELAIEGAIG